jgi:hypothetical protein
MIWLAFDQATNEAAMWTGQTIVPGTFSVGCYVSDQ